MHMGNVLNGSNVDCINGIMGERIFQQPQEDFDHGLFLTSQK